MNDTLKPLMNEARKYAEFCMRNSGGLPPAMFAMSEDGLMTFLPKDFQDEKAKDSFTTTGRLICAAYGATSVVMILESWAKFGNEDDTPPSEAFDRKEFIILVGETKGKKTTEFLPILRTDTGNFFGFGEFDSSQLEGFQGRFTEILPPKTPTKEMQTVAQAVLQVMGVTKTSLQSRLGRN